MNYAPGDLVRTKLHRDEPHSTCRVVRVKPSGKVLIRGRGGRRMRLWPHQLCLVKAVART